MVFFSIFYSIPPHPASAVSSGHGSLDRLSRNGLLLNATIRQEIRQELRQNLVSIRQKLGSRLGSFRPVS
jgi:hypothetical protein